MMEPTRKMRLCTSNKSYADIILIENAAGNPLVTLKVSHDGECVEVHRHVISDDDELPEFDHDDPIIKPSAAPEYCLVIMVILLMIVAIAFSTMPK